jgi:hypothetical protein
MVMQLDEFDVADGLAVRQAPAVVPEQALVFNVVIE